MNSRIASDDEPAPEGFVWAFHTRSLGKPAGKRVHIKDVSALGAVCGVKAGLWRADLPTPMDTKVRKGDKVCPDCAEAFDHGN